VCPITLSIFANTLTTHVPEVEFTNFYFIDINPETSHEETQRYAHLFHSEIKTYKPDEKTIDRFDSTFGLNINNIESIIEHNGKTFLLEKNQENNWYITKVFNPNTFTKHSLIRALR
jgi:cytochrome oxidase Cu insertion factor (SCO1/SenC/PrrC family)